MAKELSGITVAILVADGFEQVELLEPRAALEIAGAKTLVISPNELEVKAWNFVDWGVTVNVDLPLEDADEADFDALLLPGGVMNPDRLRMESKAVAFVRAFFDARKPIAAICHGPWMLVEAKVLRGVKVTSYPSIKTDLRNAGASWTDRETVVDRGILTSRRPADIPAFNARMTQLFRDMKAARAA
jgi:protease I